MMTTLGDIDRDAIERAIGITRKTNPDLDVDFHIKRDGWLGGGLFCVYSCQFDSIRPKLWQPVPMNIKPDEIETILALGDDGVAGRYAAARLLRRMLRAGLSRYEPEPLKALAEAKRRQSAA